ncbi:MAG: hypothetical protein IT222_09320 [Crocinitomix sp.]|nr:hypothetical protein [Crocinitomix sp.]
MNDAHFHLVVNHLPIIFPLVGVIILITGLIAKSEAVKRTAYMVFSIGAVTTIAAMTSGEGAEEVVENINGISESFIEKHEEAAELFSLLSYVLGGLSLIGLWASFRQKTFSSIVSIAVLGLAFIVLVFAKQTGTSGGEIRHDEIRSGTSTTQIPVDNDDDDD